MDRDLKRIYQLEEKIINGEISLKEVEKEIKNIEAEFGNDVFLPYTVNKETKPWDETYLKKLENLSAAGAASKEFILHLAEVKEEVSNNKRNKRKKQIGVIVGSVAAVIAVIAIIVCLCNRWGDLR